METFLSSGDSWEESSQDSTKVERFHLFEFHHHCTSRAMREGILGGFLVVCDPDREFPEDSPKDSSQESSRDSHV